MYTYLKTNYRILTSNDLNNRKLLHMLEVILAVMVLCVLADSQVSARPLRSVVCVDRNVVGKSAAEDIGRLFEINAEGETGRILAKNKISQTFLPPDSLVIKAMATYAADKDPAVDQIAIADSLSTKQAEPIQMPEQPAFLDIPEEPAVKTPKLPEFAENASQPGESAPVSDTEQPSSGEDADNQQFLCHGFICDRSGKIIGCSDVNVTDGVICLPSDPGCTGVAAGALSALGIQALEIYIPANIIVIEDGAFDGLTELCFIQVHPDNPVYGSSEGCLYRR